MFQQNKDLFTTIESNSQQQNGKNKKDWKKILNNAKKSNLMFVWKLFWKWGKLRYVQNTNVIKCGIF